MEVAIGSVLLMLLGATIVESTGSMKRMALTVSTDSALQDHARRALRSMLLDLRRSGFVELGGLEYPHLFENGVPNENYGAPEHAHAPATKAAVEGDLDFGATKELLFVLPADDDGDGAPDVNIATGALQWDDSNMLSYAVVDGADGRTSLVRRTTDGGVRVVARDVERMWIENWEDNPELPPNGLRIQLWFRSIDGSGQEYRYRVESWVSLRNGITL